MLPILVMAGLSVLAAAASWRIDQRPGSGAATSRSRWCYGTYMSTAGGRTLIITGCGIGTAAIAITEPTPPAPDRATAAARPSIENPTARAAATDIPAATPPPVQPQTDHSSKSRVEAAELVELVELERLWQLPSRCPITAATPPAPEVYVSGQETPA
jgi:hypothetical protein